MHLVDGKSDDLVERINHYSLINSQFSSEKHQYPSRSIPSFVPFTEPCVSHSSDARNNIRWFFSHIALWEEHPRSMNTFWRAPRSVNRSRTRSGGTCLS